MTAMARPLNQIVTVIENVYHEWQMMRQRRFDFLTLFIAGSCNARCSFCFYGEEMAQQTPEMSLAEIARLAETAPPFNILLLSGGEPFLRRDMPQLVSLFRRHNRIKVVSVPTNGLLPDRIERYTAEILELNPGLSMGVNISLDAMAEKHDELRQVPGNFDKAMQSLDRLTSLRERYPGRLEININSVICSETYEALPDLARFIAAKYDLDGHFFEIIRPDPVEDKSLTHIPVDDLREFYEQVFEIQMGYFRRRKRGFRPLRWWRRMAFGGNLLYQYRTQYGNYAYGRLWDVACSAGQTIGVVDHDGQVRACELHEPIANLKDYGGDFKAVYHSEAMEAERSKARSHACDCTHVCYITSSRMHSPRIRYWLAPWLYTRYILAKRVVD